jgi:hypothetical protein
MARAKKKSPKKTVGKKAAATKTMGGSAEPKMTKTAFVLAQPRDMPAAEIIAKAAEVGISLNKETVYSARTKAKTAAKEKPGRKPKTAAASSTSNGAITDFYRVLKRVGVAKAKELIANIEAFQNA